MTRYTDYDAFAWIYNRYWGPYSAQRFLSVLERRLLPLLPPRARILDLCCGTGQLAQALMQRGYLVTGIDSSEEMIRFARMNAPDAEFLVEDARMFRLPAVYHAVISTYDSLNHIMSEAELAQVFRNVWACLQPGGWFLFDLIDLRFFKVTITTPSRYIGSRKATRQSPLPFVPAKR
jgi:SAM-dependent methyltransferase